MQLQLQSSQPKKSWQQALVKDHVIRQTSSRNIRKGGCKLGPYSSDPTWRATPFQTSASRCNATYRREFCMEKDPCRSMHDTSGLQHHRAQKLDREKGSPVIVVRGETQQLQNEYVGRQASRTRIWSRFKMRPNAPKGHFERAERPKKKCPARETASKR
mmetsp:Transcript_26311/g.77803  ORF Transcript_26311/g.77803 Transcript_26311/m.77803 type:complete len:159 (-) Transcript_26311:14-490(-)